MDDLNPQAIFIVVTVFILFINKVVEMMKARHAERANQEAAREAREQRSPQRTHKPPLRSAPRTELRPTRQPVETKSPPQSSPKSPFEDVLTELFEAAGVPQKQEPPAPVAERQPPPIPDARKPSLGSLTKAEREALQQIELRNERSAQNRRRRRRQSKGKIAELLMSPDAAAQAIVVAEILGPPRAMKEIERF